MVQYYKACNKICMLTNITLFVWVKKNFSVVVGLFCYRLDVNIEFKHANFNRLH